MSPRIAVVLLLTGFGSQALCQTAPAATPSPAVPRNIVYEAFFRKVLFLQDVANKLDAKKEDGAAARAAVQKAVGLTDQETSTLNALAADWKTQIAANLTAAAPLIQTAHSQMSTSGAVAPSLVQQIQGLQSNRSAIDAAHIQQFQSSLGSARFAVIDAAVQAASTVKTVKVQPPGAAAPAGGKP
jgi:hypothetical protein